MDDVMRFSNKTMGPEFLDNNYKASFVEQEIGFSKSSFIFYLIHLEIHINYISTVKIKRSGKGVV